MINNCEDAITEIKKLIKHKGITKYGNYSFSEFYGDIGVEINLTIDISYIDNFDSVLKLLSNVDDSPLLNDGYVGIEEYQYPFTDVTAYIIDNFHVFENLKNKTTFIESLKKECNGEQVDEIVEKCIQLSSLGFQVKLIYSYFSRERFEEEQRRLKNHA